MKTISAFHDKKKQREKITLITCYDFWSAKILNETSVDAILVGDSLAMVMYGHETTLPATVELMNAHVAAVVRGAKDKFVIADMPFLSFRKGLKSAMDAVEKFMVSGAHAVKLEGVWGHERVVGHIVESGVPVMGHIGLTPQSVHQLGGFKIQGKTDSAVENLVAQAKKLQDLGCFSIVVECVPQAVGKFIASELKIPVIGIGAGKDVDGQVLVLHDVLGLSQKKLKFARGYANGLGLVHEAVDSFCRDVKGHLFPGDGESFV